jgi:hypothetical protein
MGTWRRIYLTCLFLVIPIPVIHVHNDDEVPINDARELVEWCRNEVEQLYLARDQVPRNWCIAQTHKGNYIKMAACQVRKGAQRRYAIFQPDVEK